MAKRYNTMEEFFFDEVVHESNVRAMTDDFSVVDMVMKEENDFTNVDDEYDELCDEDNCSTELHHFKEED